MGVVSRRCMKSLAFCFATPAAQAMSDDRFDASIAAIVTLRTERGRRVEEVRRGEWGECGGDGDWYNITMHLMSCGHNYLSSQLSKLTTNNLIILLLYLDQNVNPSRNRNRINPRIPVRRLRTRPRLARWSLNA